MTTQMVQNLLRKNICQKRIEEGTSSPSIK